MTIVHIIAIPGANASAPRCAGLAIAITNSAGIASNSVGATGGGQIRLAGARLPFGDTAVRTRHTPTGGAGGFLARQTAAPIRARRHHNQGTLT